MTPSSLERKPCDRNTVAETGKRSNSHDSRDEGKRREGKRTKVREDEKRREVRTTIDNTDEKRRSSITLTVNIESDACGLEIRMILQRNCDARGRKEKDVSLTFDPFFVWFSLLSFEKKNPKKEDEGRKSKAGGSRSRDGIRDIILCLLQDRET